jgi:hypothetical protein
MRLHFGLGNSSHVDRIEVRWIGGDVDVIHNPGTNRLVTIRQGQATSRQTQAASKR